MTAGRHATTRQQHNRDMTPRARRDTWRRPSGLQRPGDEARAADDDGATLQQCSLPPSTTIAVNR